ncbi:hypothetical protein JJB07_17425 [Tumebacillus sp. ITR2]|uniref:Copper amine oxidase n=1 Tax=Tumebacillus amylolyticus TaxID=2801339 RepID=A0ABS1JDL9_9BACL|nr:stalk domain-containing protein [Tumebacillus amylolyticus]MBL0388389.1 hypothetical protein [Tumebacillus amylolyticus]
MKKFLAQTSVRLALVTVLTSGLIGTGAATADVTYTSKLPHHFVALGDSLTLGLEPGVDYSMNEPYGFVDRLYEDSLYTGRTYVKNYGVAGLNSTGLVKYLDALKQNKNTTPNEIQADLPESPRTDQLFSQIEESRQELAVADLITVTIGANDFAPDFAAFVQAGADDDVKAKTNDVLDTLSTNLRSALATLHELAPHAQVVIADGYVPYFTDGDQATYDRLQQVSEDTTTTLDEIADSMKSDTFPIKVAHVSEKFNGHERDYTHLAENDVHPNQAGYEAMADAFAQAIWGGRYRITEQRQPINVIVKGKEFHNDYEVTMINDRAYLPLREFAEAVGAEVGWDEENQAAIISMGESNVKFSIGSDTLLVNGEEVKIDAPVHLLYDGTKTYVPLRAISQGLGFDVEYISNSNTAYINN